MSITLKDIIDERVIEVDIDVSTKEEAIDYLASLLEKNGYVGDKELYIKDIYEREALGKTGIGNYVAIPHGQSSTVLRNGIAIGKLKREIEWETLDDNGVKVVCLFSVSDDADSGKDHLMMLAQLAGKLGNDENIEQLLSAENKEDIVSVFI